MVNMNADFEFPEVFNPLLKSKGCRYLGAHGGRGSGKSVFFSILVITKLLNEKARIVCLREIQRSIKDSVKELIVSQIKQLKLENLFEITEHEIRGINGSLCIFRGLQSHTSASLKSLSNFNYAFIDEAQQISQASLDVLLPTIREPNSQIWFSWNPVSRLNAIEKLLRRNKPKNAIVVEANYDDNPFFPEVLEIEKERDYSVDPEKAAHIWGGEYASIHGGAYYSALIRDARKAGRIAKVDYEPDIPVSVSWDLGIGDSMSLVLWQQTPESLRIIDHYENHSQPLPHYVKWLETRPYQGNYSTDWVPHDARVRELGTGLSRVETLKNLDRNPRVVPNHKIQDGINAVRGLIPIMWFDEEKCEHLLECLMQYREDYDARLLTLKSKPLHDWTSHSADAIRYGCMAFKDLKIETKVTAPIKFDMSLNKPPTLDELWEQHESYENVGNW